MIVHFVAIGVIVDHPSLDLLIRNNLSHGVCVYLMVFNATSTIFQLYHGGQFFLIGGGNRSTVKTTDLSQVTDKLYPKMMYTSPCLRFELTTSVVIGTDCIGCCKSNYHMITTKTAPLQKGWIYKRNTIVLNFRLSDSKSKSKCRFILL